MKQASKHKDGCCSNHLHEQGKELKNAKFKFKVANLDCANCAMKIESAIKDVNYVKDASLNFSSSLLFVDSILEEKELVNKLNVLINKIEKGVSISPFKREKQKNGGNKHTHEIIQLIVGISLFLLITLFEDQIPVDALYIYLMVYLISGYHVIYTAIKNISKGEWFDENFLMSIATITAFMIGSYEEAVAVMLFYDVGELFQSVAVSRSRRSITDLMDIHVEQATVLRDGKEVQIIPEEISIKDRILVKAGERIPVDGIVVEGTSSLDVSALTGESLPKDIGIHDEVLAGCLNLNGLFILEATKLVHESTVARVLDLVENASSKKAQVEKFITKFSKVYTPLVVVAAILLFVIPVMIQGWHSYDLWLYRACTFLVISCPCALVISIPLGLFAGIGASSKQGVLVKGGNYLELIAKMDTIVFDKTGTITKGVFKVQEVVGADDLLPLAAYGESYSNHPIAKSIIAAYGEPLNQNALTDYEEISGFGIRASYQGKKLLVGNARLLLEHGISFEQSERLGSIVYVAYDQSYKGYLVINDEIKETSYQAIQSFKQLGIKKTVMLSGDRKEVAEAIAKEVGIDKVHAQLLPQDKVVLLEKYLNPNSKVAFVGDGINDAPALMRCDIGIAMGGIGSDAAIEASDVVLMNDDLLSIAHAIKIARNTRRILWQNISFSIFVKVAVLVLTVFGFANMWMGVFADVGVTLLAIINAMRTLYMKNK